MEPPLAADALELDMMAEMTMLKLELIIRLITCEQPVSQTHTAHTEHSRGMIAHCYDARNND